MRNNNKKYLKIAAIALFAVVLTGVATLSMSQPAFADCETAILPESWCNDSGDLSDNGIMQMVRFVVSLLSGGVTLVGVIGIIICGVMYLTARDNEAQVAKAKKRLIDVVIGVTIWILFSFGAASIGSLLMPNADYDDVVTPTTGS